MKDIKEEQWFVELTDDEEASIAGGAIPAILVGLGMAGASISAIVGAAWAFRGWLGANRGNGFIFGDRKGSSRDLTRAGATTPNDLPYGWNWGIRENGEWRIGGYRGPKPS